MKFMLTFTFKPKTKERDEAVARFKQTGGKPPEGAKLLGRWTTADFGGGFVLLEAEDAKVLTEFALIWSDLMELRVVPVVEDPELTEVLQLHRPVTRGEEEPARAGRTRPGPGRSAVLGQVVFCRRFSGRPAARQTPIGGRDGFNGWLQVLRGLAVAKGVWPRLGHEAPLACCPE